MDVKGKKVEISSEYTDTIEGIRNMKEREKIDYISIFKFYEVQDDEQKHDLRKKIKKMLKEEYGTEFWGYLNESQRQKFIYFDIKETVIDFLSPNAQQGFREKIEKKIKEKFGENIVFLARVDKFNKDRDNFYKKYGEKDFTERQLRYAYDNHFKEDFMECDLPIPVPSKAEWKKNPLRIYDYYKDFLSASSKDNLKESKLSMEILDHVILRVIMKYLEDKYQFIIHDSEIEEYIKSCHEDENQRSDQTDTEHKDRYKNDYSNQVNVNHIILQIILKYLENEHQLKINIPLITECLTFVEKYKNIIDIDEFDRISIDGWEIGNNLEIKWFNYCKMLLELTPFYEVEKK